VATNDMDDSEREKVRGRLKDAVLIAGPTASGKSALALEIAERVGGAIINTDSMQGYAVLNVLTARPTADDLRRVPHHLYGHVHPSTAYSTGKWLRDVMRLIDEGVLTDRVPIFVGGTGLYFRALVEGLSEMPEIPEDVRNRWRYELMERGSHKLHQILTREDPETAELLKPGDGQRIVRALEVLQSSGRSIREWQKAQGQPLIDGTTARKFIVDPDRAELAQRIDARLDRMVDLGAPEEVERLLSLALDPALPAMKAIGVREFSAAASEEITIEEAISRAKTATRQYAKRQMTWFRNQLGPDWKRIGSIAPGFVSQQLEMFKEIKVIEGFAHRN
jgi:tRNA dimethylallyltransferase